MGRHRLLLTGEAEEDRALQLSETSDVLLAACEAAGVLSAFLGWQQRVKAVVKSSKGASLVDVTVSHLGRNDKRCTADLSHRIIGTAY